MKNFNIDLLDTYERFLYNDLVNRGNTKEEALNVLINSSEESERSEALNELVEQLKNE